MTATCPRAQLAPLAEPNSIDEVLAGVDQIIEWSIETSSKIGYFAVIYKRVTLGIKQAIANGEFDDGERIERLDVVFARRYFTALNAFFHPDEYRGLTLPWEVAFVGDQNDRATMLQHMMAAFNAHITFDLAPATLAVMDGDLKSLENDFNRVNAVLCSQIPGVLDIVEELSPAVRIIRFVVPSEVPLLKATLKKMRSSAWLFAVYVALNPDKAREKEVNQASWTAALSAWYLQPPLRHLSPVPLLVRWIGAQENPDVAHNLRALLGCTHSPARMSRSYLLPSQDQWFSERIRRARASSGQRSSS